MKKQIFDFMRQKGPSIKEINLSFSQSQNKKSSSEKAIDEPKENLNNQSLAQVEISFWKKNIMQLDDQYESLKSFNLFKEKQLSLLKCELEINSNVTIENKKKENQRKLKEIQEKYEAEELKLKEEINYLKKLQSEVGEFTLNKYKIKNEISKLKNRIEKAQNDKKQSTKKSAISFNKIDASEIQRQYKGIMTTTHGELCRSKLGNKLLLSLNVDIEMNFGI